MKKLGNTTFDEAAQLLRDDAGKTIALRAQSIRVLDVLIKAQGTLLTKDELVKAVWGKTIVGDDSLVQCIKEIRQALGDTAHNILQTVHRRGYCLNMTHVKNSTSNLTVEIRTVPLALAVMPFSSRDGDEISERFAKTFAADLLSKLALHQRLPLISRHASFALRGQAMSAAEMSVKLQARYVVTGQVQTSEATTHWSLEMLDGETNQLVWSERQQVKFGNALVELDELLKRIAGTIQNFFSASVFDRSLRFERASVQPFDSYVRVIDMMLRSTPESAAEALRMSALFVVEQPNYALAWAYHANTHLWDMYFCFTGLWKDDRVEEVLAEINKAIELDRMQPYSYSLLAQTLCCNGQFEESQVALRSAIKLSPSDVMLLTHHAHVHFYCGRLDASLACATKSMAVAPSRPSNGLAHKGRTLVFLNRQAEGIANLTECVVLTPGQNWARMALIVALEETGEHAKAAHHYAELLKYTRNFDRSFFGRRWSAIPAIRDRYVTALSAHGFS